MAHHRRITWFVVLLAALALPSAASAHPCSAHARGGKITHKTKEAHVFEKNDRWYGCTTRTGRPYVLPGLDRVSSGDFSDGTVPDDIRLAGVFVAYERYTLFPAGGAGDTQTDLWVVDLRTGKAIVKERATVTFEDGVDSSVSDVVLKRNGSVGWIGDHDTMEVHRYSTAPGSRGRLMLDRGDEVVRDSLELSGDRRTMIWTSGSEQRAAELP